MRLPRTALFAAIALPLLLAGCSRASSGESPGPAQSQDSSASRSTGPTAASSVTPSTVGSLSPTADRGVVGTVVRFTAKGAVVEVVIDEDNPTTRSFLAMLPMTLVFSDYGGKEKISTPTGVWDFTDAPGLDPEAGDLFSYKPWGNLGFFYNTAGNTFSNDLARIGKTQDIEQIEQLDGQQVTIAVAG
ncbi:cyclophilin-like fold protein [Paenarthrobacter sp. NPDC089989]|uniref:cyclophilin-like fold protein n=1 Tax=unclassified Paenarthrobacter TaxID=2634190 RepID=UPI0038148149